jgi:hypothetical protein
MVVLTLPPFWIWPTGTQETHPALAPTPSLSCSGEDDGEESFQFIYSQDQANTDYLLMEEEVFNKVRLRWAWMEYLWYYAVWELGIVCILVDIRRGKKASSRSKYVCLLYSYVYRIVSTLFFSYLKRSILLAYNYVHRTRGPPFIFTAFSSHIFCCKDLVLAPPLILGTGDPWRTLRSSWHENLNVL